MISKPGAGCARCAGIQCAGRPHHGHLGERAPGRSWPHWTPRFGITVPRRHGHDTVNAIRAMRDGTAKVFIGMGGNFAAATPDTEVTEAALRNCALTVQVSTKLNRSHLVNGRTALILPPSAAPTVTWSTGANRLSRSRIRCRWCTCPAAACRRRGRRSAARSRSSANWPAGFSGRHPVPWEKFSSDYDAIRDEIAAVVPGCSDYNRRVRRPDGFQLPHPPGTVANSRRPPAKPTSRRIRCSGFPVPQGGWCCRLCAATISTTPRSTDSTTATAASKGPAGGVRQPSDIAELGLAEGDQVDLVSEFPGEDGWRSAGPRTSWWCPPPAGNAAAYCPETNPLIPLDHVAAKSNTPVSKAVIIRLESAG